jgi:hypothetical protein
MKRALFYSVVFFLSIQAFAQRTTEPVNNKSNKIIVIFPDTLSEAQIYQEVGKALVQQGYNIDSREQSFGLLMANIDLNKNDIISQDTLFLRVAVIRNEVAVTGNFNLFGYMSKLKYTENGNHQRVRWIRAVKVFDRLPVVRIEYEFVQL